MCVHSSVHCVHDVYSLLRVSKHHRRVAKLGTFYLLSFGTVQLRNEGSFCSIFQDLHSRLRVYHTWFRSETPESPQRNSLLSLLPVWQPSFRTRRKSSFPLFGRSKKKGLEPLQKWVDWKTQDCGEYSSSFRLKPFPRSSLNAGEHIGVTLSATASYFVSAGESIDQNISTRANDRKARGRM